MCLKINLKRKRKKMIVLNKNSTTNFVATLYELSILTDPNYLFKFTSDQTKQSYYTIIADISTNKPRYNEFNFIEGVNDALNGSLILGQGGYYTYEIYEQTSATNLDPTGLNKVEQGKMKLLDSTETPDFTSYTTSTSTNVVYNPS